MEKYGTKVGVREKIPEEIPQDEKLDALDVKTRFQSSQQEAGIHNAVIKKTVIDKEARNTAVSKLEMLFAECSPGLWLMGVLRLSQNGHSPEETWADL